MPESARYRHVPLAIVGVYSIFSLLGLLPQLGGTPALIIISIPLVTLYLFLFLKSTRRLEAALTLELTLFALAFTNLAVQMTGGLESPLFPFYYLFIFLSSLMGGALSGLLLFLSVLILETGASLFRGQFGLAGALELTGLSLFSVFSATLLAQGRRLRKTLQSRLSKLERRHRALTPADIDRESIVGTLSGEGERSDLRTVLALDQSLDSLLHLMAEDFHPFTAALFLLDKDQGSLSLQGAKSESKVLKREATVEVGRGVLGWVIKEKRELLVDEFTNPPESLGYYERDELIRSLAAIPVLLGSEVEGVLVTDWQEEREFTVGERERLRGFARQVAALLDLSKWAEAMKMEAVRFSAFQELARNLSHEIEMEKVLDLIAQATRRVLPFDCLVIALSEGSVLRIAKRVGMGKYLPEAGTFEPEGSLVGLVLTTKRWTKSENLRKREVATPLFFKGESLPRAIDSFLAAPLLAEEDLPIGVLALLSKQAKYSPEDSEHLAFLANLSSNAIEKARLYEKTKTLALRDGLTGLFNHRHFQEQLSLELKRAEAKGGEPLSLIFLDIDHFKKLNDKYGHPAGDEVLKGLARVLESKVRKEDTVARYGGEEFALILPGIEAEDGLAIGESIRESVEQARFIVEKDSLGITISAGLATYPGQTRRKEHLIDLADEALYRAKEEGRNRVVHLSLKSEPP